MAADVLEKYGCFALPADSRREPLAEMEPPIPLRWDGEQVSG